MDERSVCSVSSPRFSVISLFNFALLLGIVVPMWFLFVFLGCHVPTSHSLSSFVEYMLKFLPIFITELWNFSLFLDTDHTSYACTAYKYSFMFIFLVHGLVILFLNCVSF